VVGVDAAEKWVFTDGDDEPVHPHAVDERGLSLHSRRETRDRRASNHAPSRDAHDQDGASADDPVAREPPTRQHEWGTSALLWRTLVAGKAQATPASEARGAGPVSTRSSTSLIGRVRTGT
jgi:hypothetical protein